VLPGRAKANLEAPLGFKGYSTGKKVFSARPFVFFGPFGKIRHKVGFFRSLGVFCGLVFLYGFGDK
jgi:hypothetical protein